MFKFRVRKVAKAGGQLVVIIPQAHALEIEKVRNQPYDVILRAVELGE